LGMAVLKDHEHAGPGVKIRRDPMFTISKCNVRGNASTEKISKKETAKKIEGLFHIRWFRNKII
jgi:hypothetical protein